MRVAAPQSVRRRLECTQWVNIVYRGYPSPPRPALSGRLFWTPVSALYSGVRGRRGTDGGAMRRARRRFDGRLTPQPPRPSPPLPPSLLPRSSGSAFSFVWPGARHASLVILFLRGYKVSRGWTSECIIPSHIESSYLLLTAHLALVTALYVARRVRALLRLSTQCKCRCVHSLVLACCRSSTPSADNANRVES